VALLKVHSLKAVNVDYNFCCDSVPILATETDQRWHNFSCLSCPQNASDRISSDMIFENFARGSMPPYPPRNSCQFASAGYFKWSKTFTSQKWVSHITLPCVDQKVKMHILMSYMSASLLQLLSVWTAHQMNTSQFTSALFRDDFKLGKLTVNLKGYNDSPVKNTGSYIMCLHHGNKKYRVLCKVTDSKGHMTLDRKEALVVEYVSFSKIQKQTVQAKIEFQSTTCVLIAGYYSTYTVGFLWSEKYAAQLQVLPVRFWSRCLADMGYLKLLWQTMTCHSHQRN